MASAAFATDTSGPVWRITASGDWTLRDGLLKIDKKLREFTVIADERDIEIDISNVGLLDTTGAMMLQRTLQACQIRAANAEIIKNFTGMTESKQALLEQAAIHLAECEVDPVLGNSFLRMLDRMARAMETFIHNALNIISFIGSVAVGIYEVIRHPKRFRFVPMVHHMEESGLDAFPIVGLMSFLIGAVIAFMGLQVLAEFGAEIFAVDLIAITVMREFGVLLTAILIAGRSGSAYTAQIGSMKLREEIDAMKAMGINPLDALIIPRVLAMVLVLPALAFMAVMLGLLGGGLVAWTAMDVNPAFFMTRMQDEVEISHFWVGLIKAPFFAFVIAVVGCFQGLSVEGSAEDLGRKTTASVVQSLFLVILIDALFAIFFLEMDI